MRIKQWAWARSSLILENGSKNYEFTTKNFDPKIFVHQQVENFQRFQKSSGITPETLESEYSRCLTVFVLFWSAFCEIMQNYRIGTQPFTQKSKKINV